MATNSFQAEKSVLRAYQQELDAGADEAIADVLARLMSPDVLWRGCHPFDTQIGPEAVASVFWQPFRQAVRHVQRRQDIFMAGLNEIDGFNSVWVASMGHLMGLFDAPWLGIPPTGKLVFLRCAEFARVEAGKIAEMAMFIDIPHLMMQAGVNPFPPQTAAHLVQPGPQTHDGLLFDDQPPEVGEATLAAINAMISDLGTWQLGLPIEEELRRTWHEDMIW